MAERTADYVAGWQAHRRDVLAVAQQMMQSTPAGDRHMGLLELVRAVMRMPPPRHERQVETQAEEAQTEIQT